MRLNKNMNKKNFKKIAKAATKKKKSAVSKLKSKAKSKIVASLKKDNKLSKGIESYFGNLVFNDTYMKKYLDNKTYVLLKNVIDEGIELDSSIADKVAIALKEWAIENGATHYTHWFQPLTNSVAEKHDSFLNFDNKKALSSFNGKELIKGETDASSFPSGNLRATFEARGYTVWDCTSPAFLRKDATGVTLCIPTAFCSYGGEALDKKTPLLRSMQAINNESRKLLSLFGIKTKKVTPMLGVEQEYFLIDRDKYLKRKDMIYSGRTLFGAKTPKGQELDDHYYGVIKSRIGAFMKDVDEELWLLGVPAKTEHNEAAPGQHEIACIYEEANIATDHNQIVMEVLKRVATKHNLMCLFHEKPFRWVNGSGKHNNWSLETNDGINLLDAGKNPGENFIFLLVLSCVIEAVDDHASLLLASAATVGNDERLGGNEAPPSIMSIYLGEQLTELIENIILTGKIETSKKGIIKKQGVNSLPNIFIDATDRNRTSPFAFTGNKFEFRMVGSSVSTATPITILNTIVANSFKKAYEQLSETKDFKKDLVDYIKNNFSKHKKILFDGDSYSDEWKVEAERRGLAKTDGIVQSIDAYYEKENIKVLNDFDVLNENEIKCRHEVELKNYINIINIEALTMINIAKKYILPVSIHYTTRLANSINSINKVDKSLDVTVQEELLEETLVNVREVKNGIDKLTNDLNEVNNINDMVEKAKKYKYVIYKDMNELRVPVDKLEMIVDKSMWPMPSYGDLLFEVSGA